jgi:hypothetical protein
MHHAIINDAAQQSAVAGALSLRYSRRTQSWLSFSSIVEHNPIHRLRTCDSGVIIINQSLVPHGTTDTSKGTMGLQVVVLAFA